MENNDIKLTSAEISALWITYNECSSTNCFYKHFLQHLSDKDIKPIIEEALSLSEQFILKIEEILTEEKFPIPKGFSDDDIDLSAPALFTDLYALSFVYREGQMMIVYYTTTLSKIARKDVYKFIEGCLDTSKALFEKSLDLMIAKGIYDRPPKMEYPKSVEFVHDQPSLLNTWFGEGRPLNAMELQEIYCTIERNCIGLVLLIGFLQVSKDKKVKEYLKKGKKLSEKQITIFNKILKDSEEFPIYPVPMEVTDSTTSPFSERLILFFVNSSNQVGISTLGYALSVSMRKDLGVQYSLLIGEIMKYGNEGLSILIHKGWMEQPPQSTNRKVLYK